MSSTIIAELDAICRTQTDALNNWLTEAYKNTTPPIYSSVDIRQSCSKIAPVDTNLFPAGFNNLSHNSVELGAATFKAAISSQHPDAKSILILPENHTRNQGYIDNLHMLVQLFEKAGYTVAIGRLDDENTVELTTSTGQVLTSTPITRTNNRVHIDGGMDPDLIIVNNDLTAGAPEILCGIEQPVAPPTGVGWYRRKKSVYFAAYNKIVDDFAETFSIDPWQISTLFHQCGVVNFKERTGIECVAIGVEKVLHKLREKYKTYGIDDDPYVFIKADSGTYGMGIMTARSGDEVYEMNKKARNKMNVIKEGTQNTEVIIQEGVPTINTRGGDIAEPVIYLANGKSIGGAWRVNNSRDAYINLNASGMVFEPMEDDFSKWTGDATLNGYRIIAELASLAAAHEEYTTPHPCDAEK